MTVCQQLHRNGRALLYDGPLELRRFPYIAGPALHALLSFIRLMECRFARYGATCKESRPATLQSRSTTRLRPESFMADLTTLAIIY